MILPKFQITNEFVFWECEISESQAARNSGFHRFKEIPKWTSCSQTHTSPEHVHLRMYAHTHTRTHSRRKEKHTHTYTQRCYRAFQTSSNRDMKMLHIGSTSIIFCRSCFRWSRWTLFGGDTCEKLHFCVRAYIWRSFTNVAQYASRVQTVEVDGVAFEYRPQVLNGKVWMAF